MEFSAITKPVDFSKYKKKSLPKTCIDYDTFFPVSYRLFGNISNKCFSKLIISLHLDKEECLQFFEILNSEEYAQAKAAYPVQYLIKVGAGTHQGKGVDLLTAEYEAALRRNYSEGKLCGKNKDNLIAQKYISDPLLLYNQQKFDFRVYVLIAATNPLIAFYRDGFARVSLQTYYPNSTEVLDSPSMTET